MRIYRVPLNALHLLLAVSLLANAAWLITHTRSSTASPDARLRAALKNDDAEAVRDALRQMGVADDIVRPVVSTVISRRYTDRENALFPPPDPALWWKQDLDTSFENMRPAQHVEMRRIQREAKNEITRLVGPDPRNPNWLPAGARLTYLSAAKRDAVREIEENYDDLRRAVHVEMRGFQLPSDDEKLRHLKDEKQRALAAILTPDELAEYDLRMSSLADTLHRDLLLFDPTEAEYRQIFALKQASLSPADFEVQLEASLGSKRYADYHRAHDSDYQRLVAAVRRLQLPSENAATVHGFRQTVSAQALRIADTPGLTLAEKKVKLTELAQRTVAHARFLLADGEAANVHTENHMHWLKNLEVGHITIYARNGHPSGFRNLNSEQPAPVAAP